MLGESFNEKNNTEWRFCVLLGCLTYVTSEICDLDCGPGYTCLLRRSTCDYPPCPMFPTCAVKFAADTKEDDSNRHDDPKIDLKALRRHPTRNGSVLSSSGFGPVWSVNRYARPGQCPATVLTGPCLNNCIADVDCPQQQKCCQSKCGRTCRSVANVAVEKFGTCPRRLESFVGSCQRDCTTDSDCGGLQKCCTTSCGSVCSDPCYYWLEPKLRSSRRSMIWRLPFICRS